jgi:TPR repeat protein
MLATVMTASTAASMGDTETAGHSAAIHLGRLHEDAEQGSPLAQYLLGAFYQLGEAVPQDHSEAVNWYRRAANQGLAVAQFALGAMYAHGQGVPEDVVRAHMWLSLSADHAAQITGAQNLLRDAQQLREDVAQRMTPEQAVEAEQLARDWKLKRER